MLNRSNEKNKVNESVNFCQQYYIKIKKRLILIKMYFKTGLANLLRIIPVIIFYSRFSTFTHKNICFTL